MLLIPFCVQAAAAERGSWDEVQGLAKGQLLKVTTKGHRTQKGAFAGLKARSLQILEGTSETAIGKEDVLRVEVRSDGKRMRNVLIGVGVGIAIGILIDQTIGTHARNETGEDAATRAATIALPPAVLGGIAAIMPGYHTVYRASKGRR